MQAAPEQVMQSREVDDFAASIGYKASTTQ
jgi:hypothetical protein